MPRKKIKKIKISKKKKVQADDLLPESRQFLMKKELKEKGEKIAGEGENVIKKERDKRLILWSGVAFFMILIFTFWVFNLKKTFKRSESNNMASLDWGKMTEDFSKTLDQMKGDIAEVRQFGDEENATSTPDNEDKRDEINELKTRLKELEEKVGSSEEEIGSQPAQ